MSLLRGRAASPPPALPESSLATTLSSFRGLVLRVRGAMGDRLGERRFPGRPQPAGIELESHASYAPGDDLRHLDWNAVGRLDALLVRRFTAEREVLVHLLVDCSASMAVPVRDGKLAAARELALALASIALAGNDAVRVTLLRGDAAPHETPVHRHGGRQGQPGSSAGRLAEMLGSAEARGALDLGAALEDHARRHPRPGAALVISDFMTDPTDLERGVLALRSRGYGVVLLHVIGAGELEPAREFRHGVLRDVESGGTHPIALTRSALERYGALLAGHLAALEAVATRAEATYARMSTASNVGEFVTGELGRVGVVRRR
ncbi:MAG: DUF58 domain-containing protein [Deltaproteobacteria bacterium]|nr:MAG: DUF58 domain-containing protein [Deltaproteobacteria bacterium]